MMSFRIHFVIMALVLRLLLSCSVEVSSFSPNAAAAIANANAKGNGNGNGNASKQLNYISNAEQESYSHSHYSLFTTNPLKLLQNHHRIRTQSSSSASSSSSSSGLRPLLLNNNINNNSRTTPSSRSGGTGGGAVNNRHSSSDWLYNLKTLPNSSVLRETQNPVVSLAAWATFISVAHKVLGVCGKTQLAANLCVPPTAHSLLVSSLGLLLVFRTNSAYQRFLEGRKIWEEVLSTSRNLSRLATLYRTDVGMERLGRIKNLMASFPYLLRHHIRSGCLCSSKIAAAAAANDDDDDDDLEHNKYKLLLEEPYTRNVVDSRYEGDKDSSSLHKKKSNNNIDNDKKCYVDRRNLPWRLLDDSNQARGTLERVAQAANRPLWICDRLGREIMNIPYTDHFSSRERLSMLGSVDKLTNAIGQCERIHQTAVPLNYARHALRSLTLWLFTLPFCLVKDLGLLTGPATAVMAWLLFGVYQIGHSIEDPFQGSLRLSRLCDAIRRDVLAAGGNDEVPYARESAFRLDDEEEEEAWEAPPPSALKSHRVGRTILDHHEADLGFFVQLPPTSSLLTEQQKEPRVVL